MDDLEFRRAILADPSCKDDKVLQAAKSDDSKQQLLNELKRQDKQLQQLLNVPVPEDLASKLILKQTMAEHQKQTQKRQYWTMGLAASVALAVGLTINIANFVPGNGPGVAEYALEHVYYEEDYANTTDEQMELVQVNAKLASYGAQFTQDLGRIYYANFCDIKGVKTLHMVLQGEQGRVTVFLIPKRAELSGWEDFADDNYQGTFKRFESADLVVIGDKKEPIKQFKSKLVSSMQWDT